MLVRRHKAKPTEFYPQENGKPVKKPTTNIRQSDKTSASNTNSNPYAKR